MLFLATNSLFCGLNDIPFVATLNLMALIFRMHWRPLSGELIAPGGNINDNHRPCRLFLKLRMYCTPKLQGQEQVNPGFQ